jgi:hypothetical protein
MLATGYLRILQCVMRALVIGCACILTTSIHVAYADDGVGSTDLGREKHLIDGHLRELEDQLQDNHLEQCRTTLRLVQSRLDAIAGELPPPDKKIYEGLVQDAERDLHAKEDSLLAVTMSKLRDEGMDAVLDYVMGVLQPMGLSDEKLEEIDSLLLARAPGLEKKREDREIRRAVEALEDGGRVPDDVDPVLAKTADRIVEARRDSARTARRRRRRGEHPVEPAQAVASRGGSGAFGVSVGPTPFHETAQGMGTTRTVREYLRQRQAEAKKAQDEALQIYELLEKERLEEARQLFRARRTYLAENLGAEVFLVLERSVVMPTGELPDKDVVDAKQSAPKPALSELPEEERLLLRINSYLRQRKWRPAVALFDGGRKRLKEYMTRKEFRKLDDLIDSAREYIPRQ